MVNAEPSNQNRSRIVVRNRPEDKFVMVPNAFTRCSHIEPGPARVLTWMAGQSEGWAVRWGHAAEQLGVGRNAPARWIKQAAETPYLEVRDGGGVDDHGNKTFIYYVDLTAPCTGCDARKTESHASKVPVEVTADNGACTKSVHGHAPNQCTTEEPLKNTNSLTRSEQVRTAQKDVARPKQAPDAINPGDLSKADRKKLRDSLMAVGESISQGNKFYDSKPQQLWDDFVYLVEEIHQDTYDYIVEGRWSVTGKVSSPYEAGKELNKMINTASSIYS